MYIIKKDKKKLPIHLHILYLSLEELDSFKYDEKIPTFVLPGAKTKKINDMFFAECYFFDLHFVRQFFPSVL